MKRYLILFTMTSILNCTETNTKLIDATIITSDNMAASIGTETHQIDAIPTILEDGSIKMKLVIWEKN